MTKKRPKKVDKVIRLTEYPLIKIIYGRKNRVKFVIYDLMEPVTTGKGKNDDCNH